MPITVHNPDRYMAELRQILAQGRKRIGLLLGAGAPASLTVDRDTGCLDPDGEVLIPTIAGLTSRVLDELADGDAALASVRADLPAGSNVEEVLAPARSLPTAGRSRCVAAWTIVPLRPRGSRADKSRRAQRAPLRRYPTSLGSVRVDRTAARANRTADSAASGAQHRMR